MSFIRLLYKYVKNDVWMCEKKRSNLIFRSFIQPSLLYFRNGIDILLLDQSIKTLPSTKLWWRIFADEFCRNSKRQKITLVLWLFSKAVKRGKLCFCVYIFSRQKYFLQRKKYWAKDFFNVNWLSQNLLFVDDISIFNQ